ncbi:serine/threonine-protein kinase PBS1-like isoform X1 [Hibiscus syriacus]|uniref:Serine/threonine-protein kinase PBS1-like isoform X1 n=1 Tax=Hibiscus syriacus TaxID=106335 RepID=A0A6A2WJ59_HIBSY|nr:serine/threonine-protein kinase PBS1-like isoform X1 [Hibiscus syriacus]
MWSFASKCIAGTVGLKKDSLKQTRSSSEYSDDESSSVVSRDEGLDFPTCGLQWAVLKFPTLPIQLPLSISFTWCNLLSFRLVYWGNLKFPRKN